MGDRIFEIKAISTKMLGIDGFYKRLNWYL